MRFAVLTFVAVAGLAPASRGVPLCDDEQSLAPTTEIDRAPRASDALVEKPAVGPRTVDVILPCAVAESGDLGPLCVDATGWLITQTGVVLCQISLFEAAFEPLSLTERPVETLASLSTFLAAGLQESAAELALPLGHDRFLTVPPPALRAGRAAVVHHIVPG
jgi:hypothetical protein